MSHFLGDFPSLWITHLVLWANASVGRKSLAVNRGKGRACNLKCWVAISPRPGLSQGWWMVLGSMLASDVKISLRSKPSAPRLSASRDGRWCYGVKGWLKEREKMFWRKKIFDGETGGGRRWLEWTGWKKGRMNMHPHSVSLHPHSVSLQCR